MALPPDHDESLNWIDDLAPDDDDLPEVPDSPEPPKLPEPRAFLDTAGEVSGDETVRALPSPLSVIETAFASAGHNVRSARFAGAASYDRARSNDLEYLSSELDRLVDDADTAAALADFDAGRAVPVNQALAARLFGALALSEAVEALWARQAASFGRADTASLVVAPSSPLALQHDPLTLASSDTWTPRRIHLETGSLKDISCNALAIELHATLLEHFDGVAWEDGKLWLYDADSGTYRQVADEWLRGTISAPTLGWHTPEPKEPKWSEGFDQAKWTDEKRNREQQRRAHQKQRADLERRVLLQDRGGYHGATTVQARARVKRENERTPGEPVDFRPGEKFDANPRNVSAVIRQLQTSIISRANLPAGVGFFDASPALAVMGKLALVLEHGQPVWTPVKPEHRARWSIPYEYKRGAVPEQLMRVFDMWFDGLEPEEKRLRVEAMRQAGGHALLGTMRLTATPVALMLVGPAMNGKSTFTNMLRALLPRELVTAAQPAALSNGGVSDLSVARLRSSRANIVDDLSSSGLADTGNLKAALTCGYIEGRRIGGNPESFRATAAWLLNANQLPFVKDAGSGFRRRWRLVEMPNVVAPTARVPNLERRLLATEGADIVSWLVDAALDMLRAGADFARPACHDALMQKWSASGSPVAEFVSEMTTAIGSDVRRKDWTPMQELYLAFCKWTQDAYGGSLSAKDTNRRAFWKQVRAMPGVEVAPVEKGHDVVNRRIS